MPHHPGHPQPPPPDTIPCGCEPSTGARCEIGHTIHNAKQEAHRRAMQLLEDHIASGCADHTWQPYRDAQLEETDLMQAWADHLESERVAA